MNSSFSPDALARAATHFEANFEQRGELGASVSIWRNGENVLSLHHGHRDRSKAGEWTADTLVPFWSATKGLAAAAALKAVAEGGLNIETRVRRIWPQLKAAMGGSGLTVGELLSHQAGLPALDGRDCLDVADYPAVITALEQQEPLWPPGKAHGYHARTFGFLVDELVRRITGASSLGFYWREAIAGPLGLDLWIGLPESEHSRVATLIPGKSTSIPESEADFYNAFGDPESLTRATFQSPRGLNAVADMNRPEAWTLALPALGGVGTADALSAFYSQVCEVALGAANRVFPHEMKKWLTNLQAQGFDKVLLRDTAFSAGFMKDPVDEEGAKLRRVFGTSEGAFGHPGAGGSHAFADPENRIAFAYTMNQMELGVLPNQKALGMVDALYGIG